MHIDFGFLLGETPKMGKVPIFSERAPFKLTAEFWDVLGGWNINGVSLTLSTASSSFVIYCPTSSCSPVSFCLCRVGLEFVFVKCSKMRLQWPQITRTRYPP